MKPTVLRIGAILFLSGFCSLVYQVTWLRLLRLVFGSSTAATAAVLAIFMGGLGLGGALLGRRVERFKNPLAFYAALEIAITLSAAASPFVVAFVRWLYVESGGASALGTAGATAVRLAMAVAVLAVPTTLMGGTLPAVARAMERDTDAGRRLVAVLYGVNTAGAVAGAFLTTFVFLEAFGVRTSLWLACALNAAIAAAAFVLSRRAPEVAPAEVATAEAARPAPEKPERDAAAPLVLFAAFVVGFIFFLMEIVWYRMLGPVLGGSSYTFGLILTVALFGIGAGGLLYAAGARERRPTLRALSWTCLAEALCLVVPYALGDDLAFVAAVLRRLDGSGFVALVCGWTVVTAVVVLPAAVVAGYQFPLLIALLGRGRERVATQVGLAYAWNTWGAILGSLLGGFGLLPLMTAPRLWWGSGALLVVLGLVLAAVEGRGLRRLAGPAAIAAAALLLCLARGPTAFWRHTPIGAGRFALTFDHPNELRAQRNKLSRTVVAEADGVESSVALIGPNDLALYVNGKSDGAALGDAPTTVWLALLGALLHGAPRDALVIGLGTGTTSGWLARVDSIERIDTSELEPAVTELVHYFAPMTFDVENDPRLRLLHGDGREYVITADTTYDLVISEPSNPYRAGVADLFSQDFYRAVRDCLAEDGIFVQWLQGYELDADVTRLVYSTLASVFGHVETWQVHSADLLLVAGREGIVHDVGRIRRDALREPYRSALERVWWVEPGAEGFYSGYVGGDPLARHLAAAAGSRVSSDDRPRIEFGFARNLGRAGSFDLGRLRTLSDQVGAARALHLGDVAGGDPAGGDTVPLDWGLVAEARRQRAATGSYWDPVIDGISPGATRRHEARQAFARGDLAAAGDLWLSQDQEPRALVDRLLVAESLAERGDGRAEPRIEALRSAAPTESELLEARYRLRRGEPSRAARHLAAGLRRLRSDALASGPLARRALPLAEELASGSPDETPALFAALEAPFAVYRDDELRRLTRVGLARQLERGRCVEAFAAYEPFVVWKEPFLRLREECYRESGHALQGVAERDLGDFLDAAPPSLPAPAEDEE